MVDPIEFEKWIESNLAGDAAFHPSSELQAALAEAVMMPEVTIVSRAVSLTGVDEIQARMTLAMLFIFKGLVPEEACRPGDDSWDSFVPPQ